MVAFIVVGSCVPRPRALIFPLTLGLAGGCAEINIVEHRFDPDDCPLDGNTVREHASFETGAPTDADLADWATAQDTWQSHSTGTVRDMAHGAQASNVLIAHALSDVGRLQAARFVFDDTTFDRSDIEEIFPEWAGVAHLPCDFTELSATALAEVRFGDHATLSVPGSLQTTTGGVSESPWFAGQSTGSVDLSSLHPALAALSEPIPVSVVISAAEPYAPRGVLRSAEGENVVEFGLLEGVSNDAER